MFGRVKHKRRDRIGSRSVTAHAFVGRNTLRGGSGYLAYACLARTRGKAALERARGGNSKTYPRTCTRDMPGRTPQSAIAKAFKALSATIATRKRRRRR